MVVREFPYTHKVLTDGSFEREFSNTNEMELVWHRDREDRVVTLVSGEGWMLQMDDSLPVLLESGTKYFIPKETYHRLIMGSTPLVLNIKE